ncbi:histidinol-phosphate aminotransferase [Saccharopolyspora erythraea NRRL 2338]|uniref:Aromatic amino acid aminotransferase n=2 Tax=Saccharopolyspora erythraea TaxID=1836 RepID=A4F695_SACEN|nr:histidinol-phosphate transaminase [Saccharopolyspora erythraea]EQD88053.1 aminotransferase [Saccharopolyspora erythraea D]PFG93371.1 histidinol-phosphate aminotransferase [Saccharopolyspora erythraea NRRL 2338]QRK90206.1 histidinol-phosphate transaminase [Saccharopolyspora erythraea]CAL99569.1 putative histidinol-phosphate aminotransferase [Saccharopolyspora erythraea NRRL 2338]
MTVRTRADLDQLPAYVAGRTVPGSIKLASNEVSAGPLPSVVETITRAAAEVHRYPDMGATKLTEALADKLHVAPERLAVGCGSVALCEQLVQATCSAEDEVVYPWRSFEAYPIITRVVGARQIPVPLTGEHALDLDAMASAITSRTRLVFVCSPNNPTGPLVRRAELEAFLDRVPSDVLVVLDEAYWEFVSDPEAPDGVEVARARENVASMRTFSKAYGLAGLRVGYTYAPEHVAAALRKVCIPFSVNAVAQAAAVASLEAQDELKERCDSVVSERRRVRDELLGLGYEVPETQANFVWLPLGESTQEFNEHCLDNRVVVRAFVGEGARVTIGRPEENDTFLAAARSYRR